MAKIEETQTFEPDRMNEVVLWQNLDPKSVINLLPPVVKGLVLKAKAERPEWFSLDEDTLAKALRKDNQTVTPTDNRIRIKFWMEYDRVVDHEKPEMLIKNIIANICSREMFYERYLTFPGKVAWMMCPSSHYVVKVKETLEFGLDQLRLILNEPLHDENGVFQEHIAKLKITIFKMIDDRKNGVAPQKVVGQFAHIHAEIPSNDRAMIAQLAESQSEKELEERLKLLRQREKAARHEVETSPEIQKLKEKIADAQIVLGEEKIISVEPKEGSNDETRVKSTGSIIAEGIASLRRSREGNVE